MGDRCSYRQAQWYCPLGLMVIQLVVISQLRAAGDPGTGLHWTHGTALTGAGDAWASNENRAKIVAKSRVKKVAFIVKSEIFL